MNGREREQELSLQTEGGGGYLKEAGRLVGRSHKKWSLRSFYHQCCRIWNHLYRGVHRYITLMKIRFSEDSCTGSSGNHWWAKLSAFVQQRGWKPFVSELGQRQKREVKEIVFKSLPKKPKIPWPNGS